MFLPAEDLMDGIQYLANTMPLYENKCQKFFDYFLKNWVHGNQVKAAMWNHSNTITPRTNNHVEGQNHNLKTQVQALHPDIYTFCQVIQNLERETVLNYLNLDNTKLSTKKRKEEDIERDKVIHTTINAWHAGTISQSINAASMCVFGNEKRAFDIKLAVVYMLLEYAQFFQLSLSVRYLF